MSLAYSWTIVLLTVFTVGLCGLATFKPVTVSTPPTGRWFTVAFLLWILVWVSLAADTNTIIKTVFLVGGPVAFIWGIAANAIPYLHKNA